MSDENEERRKRFSDMGHLGGSKGGPARAKLLTPERRREIAAMGGKARQEKLRNGGNTSSS